MNKVKLAIGTIIFFSILHGINALNNYRFNQSKKEGTILENNIEMPKLEDIFESSKGK